MSTRSAEPGTVIKTKNDILDWIELNAAESNSDGTITATFVIDEDGNLRLSPRRSEHVACASGGPVLSAGELSLLPEGEVEEINNHSTGFCPEPESWPVVSVNLRTFDS